VVAANDKVAIGFLLSGGNVADAPKGMELLVRVGRIQEGVMTSGRRSKTLYQESRKTQVGHVETIVYSLKQSYG